jgi:hypothetical protein
MNVATIKTLLFLVSLGFFGGLVYVAVQHEQGKRAQAARQAEQAARGEDGEFKYFSKKYALEVLNNVQQPKAPRARTADYKAAIQPALIKFDWTGKPPAPKVEERPVDNTPTQRPKLVVADLLTVQFVRVNTQNPGDSAALVSWKKPDMKDANPVLKIGRPLPAPFEGAVVKDIVPDGVLFAFSRDDQQQDEFVDVPKLTEGLIVTVDGEDQVRRPVERSRISQPVAARNEWPEDTRRIAHNMYEIGGNQMSTFASDWSRMLTEDVRLVTHRDANGNRAGVKLTDLKSGSLIAQHGGQEGDVIISINGHPVSSEQEGIQYVKQNAENTTTWIVVVERLGTQQTLTYNTKKK